MMQHSLKKTLRNLCFFNVATGIVSAEEF